MDMSENTVVWFSGLRMSQTNSSSCRGRTRRPTRQPSLSAWFAPQQEFRGTEEETREFLAEKGQPSEQIQRLIERGERGPEVDAPEYIVTHTLRVS